MPSEQASCHCKLSLMTVEKQEHPQFVDLDEAHEAYSRVYLFDGMLVSRESRALQAPLSFCCHDTSPCLWLMFQLQGESTVTVDRRRHFLGAGKMVIAGGMDTPRQLYTPQGQDIRRVHVRLDERFLDKYFPSDGVFSSRVMQRYLGHGATESLLFEESVSPTAQLALRQLFQFPFDASLEMLFTESRVLDVVCDVLSSVVGGKTCEYDLALSRQDVDNLHHARELLLEDLTASPPAIAELAARVGLNEFKLKKGFRLLFRSSIHTYHRNARLDLARTLLSEGHLNVCEVACTVGYSNPSHFTRAFNNRFRINPGEYLRDIRGKGFHVAAGRPLSF